MSVFFVSSLHYFFIWFLWRCYFIILFYVTVTCSSISDTIFYFVNSIDELFVVFTWSNLSDMTYDYQYYYCYCFIRYEEGSKTCCWWFKHSSSSRKEEGVGWRVERRRGRREEWSLEEANCMMRNMESILWCSVFLCYFDINHIYPILFLVFHSIFCQFYSIPFYTICDYCRLLDNMILTVQG